MTTEALLHEVESGTEDSVVQALAGATEKERKAASAAIIERMERPIQPLLQQGLRASEARQLVYQMAGLNRRLDFRPQLALLGTGTLGEIKRYGAGFPAKAFDVLADRKPKWLPEWCTWAVHASWPVVRRLVREGYCPRPETDEYYLHMTNGGNYVGTARQLLEADPGLLEHEVWELFRRQGTRDASLANDFMGWSDALVALSAEGRLSRNRLLDASLEALELPFKPHHTTWYRNFHEAMKPSAAERAARLPLYLSLASSAVPATVKFAWKAIEAVEKAGALPVDALLDSAAPALMSKEKGTAAAVLRLLRRVAALHPECRERAARTAATALEHPAADIQSAALQLIEDLAQAAPDLQVLIASKLEMASAPVRERARGWLGAGAAVEVVHYSRSAQRPSPLTPERAIRPIEDVEDLVLTMTRVLNQNGSADDVERVLDGLSRLCAEQPPRFDDLTSPLRNQVATALESGIVSQFSGIFSAQTCMIQLAAAWLHRKLTIRLGDSPYLLQAALAVRPYWVALRARDRRPRPLLSAPTHSGGWIDPAILARRIEDGQSEVDEREWEADLRQARLRLAPGETAPTRTYELHWGRDRHDTDWLRASMTVDPQPARDLLRIEDVFAAGMQPLPAAMRALNLGEDDASRRACTIGADLIAWSSQIAPADREGWCALGALRIANNLDWHSANWDNRAFLTVFADPYAELGPTAHLLLALGLMCREATEFDTARDGLIRAIADGRLDCAWLGSVLARLFQDGVVRGSRLARAFTEAARVSPSHADAIRRVAELALSGGLPPRPADQSALLEAYLEACTASGTGPASGDLRRLLESVSGSGKGPKLARSLLALTPKTAHLA